MATGRTIALGTLLLLALAATVLLFVFVVGDRSPTSEISESAAEVAEQALGVDAADETPSLAGRADARPLKTASVRSLVSDLKAQSGSAYEAAARELRERAQSDAALVERLITRLDDPVWFPSLRALQIIGAPAARPLAAYALQADARRRRECLQALILMGPEAASAVSCLLEGYAAVEDPATQGQILWVFCKVGPAAQEALPLLHRVLTPPLDDRLAPSAAGALAAIDATNPATVEAIRTVLLDEETRARPAVLSGVVETGGAACTAPLGPLLIELLEDPEDAMRREAAAALGGAGISNQRTIDALLEMLEHDTSFGQRAAADALIALGPVASQALATTGVMAESMEVRLSVAQVLMGVEGHGEPCSRILLSVLRDASDKGWKQRALLLFARLDPPPAAQTVLPALLAALGDPTLAKDACRALANVPGGEARVALVAALGREDEPDLGTAALDALLRSMAKDPGRDALLASLMKPGPPPEFVGSALGRLPRLSPPGQASVLLPALEPWLRHEDLSLRALAHQGLGRLSGEEAVRLDRLLAGLGDPEIVATCASGLRSFPEHAHRTVPALVEAWLALPEASPHEWGVSWAAVFLARSWSGARAWAEGRRKTADPTGQKRLDVYLDRIR